MSNSKRTAFASRALRAKREAPQAANACRLRPKSTSLPLNVLRHVKTNKAHEASIRKLLIRRAALKYNVYKVRGR